jgi:hypothetical protein
MKRKISGDELRDELLSRIKNSTDSESTEEKRIEALSSPGNRELLEIIATQQPRSVNELATLAKRLQPNVSRSMSALAKAGLLTVTLEGRASVPSLTREGQRKAEDLGFIARASASLAPSETSPLPRVGEPALSATILAAADGNLESDAIEARVHVRFPKSEGSRTIIFHAVLDLNELCTNLLANWWRVLCRRADPYKMFPLQRKTDQSVWAILLAKSTGRIELFVRPAPEERGLGDFPRFSLGADEFTALVLNELARPLVLRLHAGKRFDRPVESMLRRTEEVLHNPAELTFWKSAGALGLSYQSMTDAAAKDVMSLVNAIADEDPRLDFASAIDPEQLGQSLAWVADEIAKKAKMNSLAKLIELRRDNSIVLSEAEPWRIGKDRALEARRQIGLAQDRPVGGLSGISRMFGGDGKFAPSSAGEEALRGFQGFTNDAPVVVVKDEGPRSTAFLMSRGVGDYLVYGSREAPIANIYSDRQAVGRAFAAEFMAPAQSVVHMIDEEQIPFATVANHYGVEREVIIHQYENSVAQYAS